MTPLSEPNNPKPEPHSGNLSNYASVTAQYSSIKFDSETGTLILKGNSDQSALHHFYFPIISQLTLYFEKEKDLAVGIFFSELNPSSVKLVFNLFKTLSQYRRGGANIIIKWFANAFNQDVYDTAKDFDELYELNMEVILSGS